MHALLLLGRGQCEEYEKGDDTMYVIEPDEHNIKVLFNGGSQSS